MRSAIMAAKEISKRGLPYPKLMACEITGMVVMAFDEIIAKKAAAIKFNGVVVHKGNRPHTIGTRSEFLLQNFIDYRGSIELSNDEVK